MAKKTKKRAGKKVTKKVVRSSGKTPVTAPKGTSKGTLHEVGIRPLGDRVVIRPLSTDEMGTTSPSGIIIPDTISKEKPEQGMVLAVGAGKYEDGKRVPLQVAVGDRVVFSKYGYDEVKVGGKEYYIVSESGILAVIKD
jgi:chaperonin GroES